MEPIFAIGVPLKFESNSLFPRPIHGATENAGLENAGPSKMQGWKTRDWKTRDHNTGGGKRGTISYGTPK